MILKRNCFIVMLCLLIARVSPDMLEEERASYFGFTHEIPLSLSTMEAAEQLETAVWQYARGDRRVRRYFDSYDSPFVGERRQMDEDEDIMLGGEEG